MKVWLQGGKSVTLTQAHWVGAGGEGAVYARDGRAYKIYADPTKMIPPGKLRELAALKAPNIIKPERLLLGGKNKEPVGYVMRHIERAHALCQLFTRAFRERNGLTPERMLELVRRLQAGVTHVHRSGLLIVDLNEMNFLVGRRFDDLYFIDVDSYQTPHYPATAILPSVRDWQTPEGDWTELSDWFSFAVVSFQMLVGLHPYKGRHPSVVGLEERMRQNLTVFDSAVKLPGSAYDFGVIPTALRGWYEAVLARGERMPPPSKLHGPIVITPKVQRIPVVPDGGLRMSDFARYDQPIRALFERFGTLVAHTAGGLFVGPHRAHPPVDGEVAVAFTPVENRPVAAILDDHLQLIDLSSGASLELPLHADAIAAHDGRLYVQSRDRILELSLHDAGERIIASPGKVVARVLEHNCQLFPGVAIQSLLDATYASIFPRAGVGVQIRLPELDGQRVVDAKFDRGVLMVLAVRAGSYHRFVFRFDERGETHDVRNRLDVPEVGLNFVTLDTGVCVCLNEEEQLELFSKRVGSADIKLVEPNGIVGGLRLVARDGELLAFHDRSVYGLAMR